MRGAVLVIAIVGVASCSNDHSTWASGVAAAPAPERTPARSVPAPSPDRSLTAAPVDRKQASTTTAVALLATLPVKGRAPKTGYSRDAFGSAWTDDNDDADGHNGCDTRNDILRRDLTRITIKPGTSGCAVLSGTLHDPYTGRAISFRRGESTSDAVQIDHVVALSDAWQTGAQRWSSAKRVDFANDPLNLLAVSGPTNDAKGDGDAATWLPPNKGYRCAYVARQVAVKARYGLWVTRAEDDAVARVLSACAGQPAPGEAGAPPAGAPRVRSTPTAPRTSTRPTTTSRKSKAASSPSRTVKVYPNCDALNVDYPHGVGRPGAHDSTSSAKGPVTDFTVDQAVYEANTARDGDKDGIACERH